MVSTKPAPDLISKVARGRLIAPLAYMKSPDRMEVGIGWYTPDQYSSLKAFAADPEILDHTHEEWLAGAEKLFRELGTQAGLRPLRIPVDVQELLTWCRQRGKAVDAS